MSAALVAEMSANAEPTERVCLVCLGPQSTATQWGRIVSRLGEVSPPRLLQRMRWPGLQ